MFAPIVVLLRNWLGKAKFNQIRGKAMQRVVGVPPIVATASRSDRQTRKTDHSFL